MTGGGLGSRGLPLLGRGGAPSGCSPLLRPSHSAATARSPPLPGVSLPPGPPALHITGTVVCTVRATRPQSSTALLSVPRPPGSGPQSLTLGGERLGAARSRDSRVGSGEPGPPAARLREDDPALLPGRPPPASHLPHKLTQDTEFSSRVLIQHNTSQKSFFLLESG